LCRIGQWFAAASPRPGRTLHWRWRWNWLLADPWRSSRLGSCRQEDGSKRYHVGAVRNLCQRLLRQRSRPWVRTACSGIQGLGSLLSTVTLPARQMSGPNIARVKGPVTASVFH
jgi:hypothetical protein